MSDSERRRRWVVRVAVSILLFTVGLLLWARLGPEPGPVAERSTRKVEWKSGDRYEYALLLESETHDGNGNIMLGYELRGRLNLSAAEVGGGVLLRAEYAGAVNRVRVGPDAEIAEDAKAEVASAFARPWFMEVTADGAVSQLKLPQGVPSLVVQTWKYLAASIQFSGAVGEVWEAREKDGTGFYVAKYTAGETEVERIKERYLSVHSGLPVKYDIQSARTTFGIGERGLEALASIEHVRANGNTFVFDSRVSLSLELEAKGTAEPGGPVGAIFVTTLEMVGGEQDKDALDRARVGSRRLPDILATLSGSVNRGSAEDEEGRAYVALTALLRLEPHHLKTLREHVEAEGPLAETLIAAIGNAGTPEAQALLQTFLENGRLPVESRLAAAQGLSHVKEPTTETLNSLRDLQKDDVLGVQGTYGLGSAAYRLRSADPLRAESVVKDLVAQLKAASHPARQAEVLTALGNAGSPLALSAISELLNSPVVMVRAAAYQALRRIPGMDVDRLLVAGFGDGSPIVRLSAIDAAGERLPSPVLAQGIAIAVTASGEEFRPRAKAVHVASAWIGQAFDVLGPALQAVAASDASEDLRRIARAALDRRSPG